jgi:hypothetical protein
MVMSITHPSPFGTHGNGSIPLTLPKHHAQTMLLVRFRSAGNAVLPYISQKNRRTRAYT